MPTYASDHDDQVAPPSKLFYRQSSLHSIFGGGKVADILLWRNKNMSAAILLGFTFIWFLIEVVDYNFITLLSYSIIFLMIGIFVWANGSGLINRPLPPRLLDIRLSESAFRKFFTKLGRFMEEFYEVARGKDPKLFFLIIVSLWVFSVLGSCFSTLNLLYIGFLLIETIPALYEKYRAEIDYLASKGSRDAKKLFKKLDSKILNKIPRGPVKERRRY